MTQRGPSPGVPVGRGDYLVPVVLCALGEWTVWTAHAVEGSRALLAVGMAVAGVALAARRRSPLLALAAVGAALLLPAAMGSYVESLATILMLVVAVFACGRYGAGPSAYLGALAGVAFALSGAAADPHETLASTWAWSLNALWIFGIGLWLRQAHDLVDHTRQEQEAVAHAAAAEERLKVAQDLHDVLAHSLSLMVVQAEVADELLDSDVAAARRAIEQVQHAGRAALTETRTVLGVLRSDQTPRGLRDLAALLEDFRSAGLPVSLEGNVPGSLSAVIDRTAYRLLQEALTHVLRHADAQPTRVLVQEDGGQLVVTVENDGVGAPAATAGAGGHGLRGMRERVEACGGTLHAGPRLGGGFTVRAHLPLTDGVPA